MLLLYALLIIIFVGTLASFQLTSEIDNDTHNIRRIIKTKVESSVPSDKYTSPIANVIEPDEAPKVAKPDKAKELTKPDKAKELTKPIKKPLKTTEIPKLIHQFWVGTKKRPEQLMNYCRDLHVGWKYMLWTDETMFRLKNQKPYDCGSYNFKSDVARYEILQKYGGFYLDADTLCRRSLEPLRKKEFVVGYQHYHNPNLKNNKRYEDDLLASVVVGAPKGSYIVDALVELSLIHI